MFLHFPFALSTISRGFKWLFLQIISINFTGDQVSKTPHALKLEINTFIFEKYFFGGYRNIGQQFLVFLFLLL